MLLLKRDEVLMEENMYGALHILENINVENSKFSCAVGSTVQCFHDINGIKDERNWKSTRTFLVSSHVLDG
ncbi:hypothetical protein C922_04798 [Plasmodium inui San Antonio 1]|uniref:Uncharacterized protein n=1 Tax=Plasmodium inui San Antonio 1 TaxID=1237626 RepID=W6ZZW9_9APIC|nr:hypothetical protein C922_04798 [Plasmodium inui San Antonio 1]EUD64850.1 hypothetical protein C922_04798 [Plasmodium inui San Antonio 1]